MVAVLRRWAWRRPPAIGSSRSAPRRIAELFGDVDRPGSSSLAFLAGNVRDTDFAEPVFNSTRLFESGGVAVAVIGQAFPYTPIANPRWMIPNWSFGIRETSVRRSVAEARGQGAQVVVLLSHNGFDVDAKLAARVEGIDIILTAHTHDALPQPTRVGSTLLVASGSHGKFLSRLDVEVDGGRVTRRRLRADPGAGRRHRARSRHGRADRRHPRRRRGDAGHRARPHRRAALPPRHLRRHARRPDLRRAAGASATPRSRSRRASAGAAR